MVAKVSGGFKVILCLSMVSCTWLRNSEGGCVARVQRVDADLGGVCTGKTRYVRTLEAASEVLRRRFPEAHSSSASEEINKRMA